MKALLLSPSSIPGGAEHVFLGLVSRLPEHGIEPIPVLLQNGPLADWLEAAGIPAVVLPAGRARQLHRTIRTILALRRIARESGADVLVSSMSKGHCYGGAAARLAGIPAIWWQHGIPSASPIERTAALMRSAAVVCVSETSLAAQLRRTPRRRLTLIHPGRPVEEIARRRGSGAPIRTSLGWSGSTVVGIVGRLEPWKGQDVFLRAAALLAEDRPELRFAVVGGAVLGWEGSYPDDLIRLADELGISDRVTFAGHQEDSWAWIDALDVVVHASQGEPFGTVIVETMALHKPLVAGADGGPLEVVEHEHSGLLVPPREPRALAQAIARLLDDPELAARLAEGAGRRALAFSEGRLAKEFSELIRDVGAGAKVGHASVRVHVASLDTASSTELCVRSLRRLAGYPLELVVGDSGSTDGSVELLGRLEEEGLLRLERSPERWEHSRWLDRWLAGCEARYAVFVDSDVEFRRNGWLRELVETAERSQAALVCSELLPEGANFVEPVGGKCVRLARRPAPWLLLVDVARVLRLGTSFAFASEETDAVPEGLVAYDVGAHLFRALEVRGLPWTVMPRRYARSFHHYGGLSWIETTGRRQRKKVRDLRTIERRLFRARRADAGTRGAP